MESRGPPLSFGVQQETEALWSTLETIKIMAITVKGVNLQWNLSSEEILKRTDELIEKSKKVYDAVGALNPDDVTYENCLKASELFDRFFLIRPSWQFLHECFTCVVRDRQWCSFRWDVHDQLNLLFEFHNKGEFWRIIFTTCPVKIIDLIFSAATLMFTTTLQCSDQTAKNKSH